MNGDEFATELQITQTRVQDAFVWEKRDAPNMVMKTPPIMGSGMVTNKAPNFPSIPSSMITTPPVCTTLLLPTCVHKRHVYKLCVQQIVTPFPSASVLRWEKTWGKPWWCQWLRCSHCRRLSRCQNPKYRPEWSQFLPPLFLKFDWKMGFWQKNTRKKSGAKSPNSCRTFSLSSNNKVKPLPFSNCFYLCWGRE